MQSSDEMNVDQSDEVGPSPPELTLTRSDERVLRYLAEAGADYPALIAGNTGLHAPHVERRVDVMVGAGLIEAVSEESVYRITDAGRDALAGTVAD